MGLLSIQFLVMKNPEYRRLQRPRNRIVRIKSPEMVNAYNIKQLCCLFKPLRPPLILIFLHHIYALFMALKDAHGGVSWSEWEPELKKRDKVAVDRAKQELAGEIEFWKMLQYLFYRQWRQLKPVIRPAFLFRQQFFPTEGI